MLVTMMIISISPHATRTVGQNEMALPIKVLFTTKLALLRQMTGGDIMSRAQERYSAKGSAHFILLVIAQSRRSDRLNVNRSILIYRVLETCFSYSSQHDFLHVPFLVVICGSNVPLFNDIGIFICRNRLIILLLRTLATNFCSNTLALSGSSAYWQCFVVINPAHLQLLESCLENGWIAFNGLQKCSTQQRKASYSESKLGKLQLLVL